jgi:hypothetical protein
MAWANGINLYAAILTLGLMNATGNMDLPPDLEVLSNPLVIGAAGIMFLAEFLHKRFRAWIRAGTPYKHSSGFRLARSWRQARL